MASESDIEPISLDEAVALLSETAICMAKSATISAEDLLLAVKAVAGGERLRYPEYEIKASQDAILSQASQDTQQTTVPATANEIKYAPVAISIDGAEKEKKSDIEINASILLGITNAIATRTQVSTQRLLDLLLKWWMEAVRVSQLKDNLPIKSMIEAWVILLQQLAEELSVEELERKNPKIAPQQLVYELIDATIKGEKIEKKPLNDILVSIKDTVNMINEKTDTKMATKTVLQMIFDAMPRLTCKVTEKVVEPIVEKKIRKSLDLFSGQED